MMTSTQLVPEIEVVTELYVWHEIINHRINVDKAGLYAIYFSFDSYHYFSQEDRKLLYIPPKLHYMCSSNNHNNIFDIDEYHYIDLNCDPVFSFKNYNNYSIKYLKRNELILLTCSLSVNNESDMNVEIAQYANNFQFIVKEL